MHLYQQGAYQSPQVHTRPKLSVQPKLGCVSTIEEDSETDIYLCQANNGNTSTKTKIWQTLTEKTQEDVMDVVLMSLLLILNRFHTLLWCFHC